jgi:hypothetical protein
MKNKRELNAFGYVCQYNDWYKQVIEAADSISNCEANRVLEGFGKSAFRHDPTLNDLAVIRQIMTMDVNASTNDKSGLSILAKLVKPEDRTKNVTLRHALLMAWESFDQVGQTGTYWRSLCESFINQLDATVTLVNDPVDPEYAWILAEKVFRKTSIVIGTTSFQESSFEVQQAQVAGIFKLEFFTEWRTIYGQWKIDQITKKILLQDTTTRPRGASSQAPALGGGAATTRGKSKTPPPKTKEARKNPAACMRHWTGMAVPNIPNDERCVESSCSFTHAAPWRWHKSLALAQVEKYFKSATRTVHKPAVLDYINTSFATVLNEATQNATRVANSTL